MDGIDLIGIVVLAGIGILLARKRRPLTVTQHTVRCPAYDCRASVAVRTDFSAAPSHRHVDVTTCSLMPSTPFTPPARTAYFSDMSPAEPYVYEISQAPRHSDEVGCPKRCL